MTGLEERYDALLVKYHFHKDESKAHAEQWIPVILKEFLAQHRETAIYCYGQHTKMLMTDFIAELRSVRYIIDNYFDGSGGGFEIIREDEIPAKGIDAVIISTYLHREEVKTSMRKHHPDVAVLDLYDALDAHGCHFDYNYYAESSAYADYLHIYALREKMEERKTPELQRQLVEIFVQMKDFRLAAEAADRLTTMTGAREDAVLSQDLRMLYEEELEVARHLSEDHVLMLCLDGLRRRDICREKMPKLEALVEERGKRLTNAYSFSTMTYESLLPAYSGNSNRRTLDATATAIPESSCRFVKEAVAEGRPIHFYTEGFEYVHSSHVTYEGAPKSAPRILWQFLCDASKESHGLYYVHILYETHYSFVNPYTRGNLVISGMAMLFDYLEREGGKLRTDYVQQHDDMLRYIDDTVSPVLSALTCRTVLFADHGNLLLKPGTKLADVHPNELNCHEDWIQIPFVLFSPENGTGEDGRLFSLMNINDVVCSLLQKQPYKVPHCDHVKIGRSEIYNPDFHFIYQKMGEPHRLLAFEGFLFATGEKLIVYADGAVELYDRKDDSRIEDAMRMQALLKCVQREITVCPLDVICVP